MRMANVPSTHSENVLTHLSAISPYRQDSVAIVSFSESLTPSNCTPSSSDRDKGGIPGVEQFLSRQSNTGKSKLPNRLQDCKAFHSVQKSADESRSSILGAGCGSL